MRLELVGIDCPVLPGVTVGVQRGSAVIDERPAEGGTLQWVLDVPLNARGELAGAFVHGRRGARFLYLSWSRRPTGMFRRAKLPLTDLPAGSLEEPDRVLRAVVRLVMADGSPVCATVRSPGLVWCSSGPSGDAG